MISKQCLRFKVITTQSVLLSVYTKSAPTCVKCKQKTHNFVSWLNSLFKNHNESNEIHMNRTVFMGVYGGGGGSKGSSRPPFLYQQMTFLGYIGQIFRPGQPLFSQENYLLKHFSALCMTAPLSKTLYTPLVL